MDGERRMEKKGRIGMDVTVQKTWIKWGVLLSYLLMLTVNALANALPLNGLNTGQVANSYPNLFTPAPLTFGIWGVIYLSLAVYVTFQLLRRKSDVPAARQPMLEEIGKLFILTSVLNAGWILAWHYLQIEISVLVMVLLLLSLIRIGWLLRAPHCAPLEELALRIPFGLYLGWITVATVANVTALLVHYGWDGFGLPETFWTAAILTVALAIASVTMYRLRSVAYGLAVTWAYTGILIKHLSSTGFAGAYPLITGFVIGSLAVLTVMLIVTAVHMRRVAQCGVRNG